MDWSLADTVAAVQIGEDIIIPDLAADQYSCLRGPSGLLVKGRRVRTSTRDAAQPLIEAGVLSPFAHPHLDPARLPPSPPATDLRGGQATAIQAAEMLDFLICWIETLVRFPGRSLVALHRQVRDDGPERPPADLERVRRRVAVYETLLPWVPFPGACLFRSYLLLRFLQRRDCDARWVIGVRTWPFEAHCWLQVGDTALDDRCEHLIRFQPVLAI